MPDFDSLVFWPAFKAAGFLKAATVTSGGLTYEIDVGFTMPDRERFNGSVASREYQIEYQDHDLPGLAEGDVVMIADVYYRVRSDPFVSDDGNASGYFKKALMTKVIGRPLLSETGVPLRNEDGRLILLDEILGPPLLSETGVPLRNEYGNPITLERP